MNLLSLIRLGVDLGAFPETRRPVIDRLFIEAQPGHIQYSARGSFDSAQRDLLRAQFLRNEFAGFGAPDFSGGEKLTVCLIASHGTHEQFHAACPTGVGAGAQGS